MDGISIGLAFLAGLVSFASPCVLPLVPSYLGFVASGNSSGQENSSIWNSNFVRTLAFVLGFVIVFAILGLVFAGGALAFGGLADWLRIVAGVIVIIFAANLVFNFIPFLNYEVRAHVSQKPRNLAGALLVGMAFGAGWTPCIGPILSTILFYAAGSGSPFVGLFYLIVYGLGLGIPFIALSLGMDRFKPALDWMKKHIVPIKYVSAVVLLLMGLLIIFGQTTVIAAALPSLGFRLGQWNQQNPDAALAMSFSFFFAALALPALLRQGVLLRREPKKFSWYASISLGTFLVLSLGHFAGWWNLVNALSSWLSFQGI